MPGKMTQDLKSHLKVSEDPIVPASLSASPFTPGSGNVFPKYLDAVPQTAWELWFFDGISEHQAAIVVGFARNIEGPKNAPFRVQVIISLPDESTWQRDLYFPESVVTTSKEAGDMLGVWKDPIQGSSISFWVPADGSQAKLSFNVPGILEGDMTLTSLPGDTGLDTLPELGSVVNYMRPIGRASVTTKMSFYQSDNTDGPKALLWTSEDHGRGGMDRVWSPLSWQQVMTESYYLRAQVGPYAMQIMRIISDAKTGNIPHTVARLYRDGKLVCAAQSVVGVGECNVLKDSLILSKVYGSASDPGLTGAFQDKNNGYVVEFIEGGAHGQRWQFQVRHKRTMWNLPTSAPGPNATGNTGFIEGVVGGTSGETFNGIGTGGQCQLST
jgi:hypothetical protein